MKVLAIAAANVKRMLRDRSNIFFVFIFPLALILLIGAQFGGGFTPLVGVYQQDSDVIADSVLAELEESEAVAVVAYDDRDRLITAVERGRVNAGLLLPAGMSATAPSGDIITIEFINRPDSFGPELASVVSAAVANVMKPVGAARFAVTETGAPFDRALTTARQLADDGGGVTVTVSTLGEAVFPATLGRFDLGASQQLILFMFITGLTGASALILTRTLGVTSRMLSTPTNVPTIILGEALGRFGTSLVQGIYIVLVTLIAFGVNWGDPLGAFLIMVTFSAVAAGAAMLMGAIFSNAQQAGGVAVVVSLGLAALGGAMMAIEFFPPSMQKVAMFTPHAWAISAFAELVRHDGGVADILPQLGVLCLFALVLLGLATWRLRAVITRP